MKKHINSATGQYQDEYTDNWVLDDTPTEGSFNAVTSDGVAKAVAGGGGGTAYTAGDGIDISEGEISAKVDGTTIQVNADGNLEAIGGGGSSYTAGDGIDITDNKIKVDPGRGLEFAPSTQTTFTADYQGYDLGQWGYMGIGPLHVAYLPGGPFFQLDFRPFSNKYLAWNVANGTEYHLFAYDPQDSTKYATCNVAYQADIARSDLVAIGYAYYEGQLNHLYPADPNKWDFSGGLNPNNLTSAAIGIYFPNTTGSSPMGTDFASTASSLLQNIGYSTSTVIPDAGKLQVKVDNVTIQLDTSNGALVAKSQLPAFSQVTDVGKVLQVTANGLAWVSLT